MKDNFGFFSGVAILLVFLGAVKIVTRKGGLQYKRMLSNNHGKPPKNNIVISTEGIHTQSLDNGNVGHIDYHRIRSIAETNNLIILMMEYRQGLCIDKRTLTGGRSEEVTAFLLAACTNLKKKESIYWKEKQNPERDHSIPYYNRILICLVSGNNKWLIVLMCSPVPNSIFCPCY